MFRPANELKEQTIIIKPLVGLDGPVNFVLDLTPTDSEIEKLNSLVT